MARIFPIEMNNMSVWFASLISSQREAGDESSEANLARVVNIRNFAHYKKTAYNLHEVTFLAQAFEVVVTTEQCV